MSIRLFQIDAFAERPFSGNPAAVCLLDQERPTDWMQAFAAEMNLAETAFVRPLGDAYELRWFTPRIEVDLCGHATLATAHAMWGEGLVAKGCPIEFHTRSGRLVASQQEDVIELDFPATPVAPCEPPADLLDAIGLEPMFIGRSEYDCLLAVESAEAVRSLQPDFRRLAQAPFRGVIVTSRSDDVRFDFVSRFFAPAVGVDEDPVTGSAHCCLAPFWGERLNKTELTGYQASSRGGVVGVRLAGDRVLLAGRAVTVFSGEIASLALQTPGR